MPIHINSPSNLFKNVFEYQYYLLAELDWYRARKYIVFTFFVPLLSDVSDYFRYGDFSVMPPFRSLIVTSIFICFYCCINFFFRLRMWKRDLRIEDGQVYIGDSQHLKVIGNIQSSRKIGERILEIVTDSDADFKLKNKFIDIVFANAAERDLVYSRIRGGLS